MFLMCPRYFTCCHIQYIRCQVSVLASAFCRLICLSVCSCIGLSVCLSACLPACLSVYLSVCVSLPILPPPLSLSLSCSLLPFLFLYLCCVVFLLSFVSSFCGLSFFNIVVSPSLSLYAISSDFSLSDFSFYLHRLLPLCHSHSGFFTPLTVYIYIYTCIPPDL